ncbi:MAG TPA: translation initiation factor IF-2 [Sorangium sp.]|nr:translation initiation factor IF-2 [Sorangium sp.]
MAGRHMRPGFGRGRHYRSQRKGPVEVSTKEMSARKKFIRIEGETTVQQLANKMSMKATEVLMKLLSMGMTGVHINSTLDADTAKLLAAEFGWTVEDVSLDEAEELQAAIGTETGDEGEAVIRPPIVTVMGHVDHGKTTLLDAIRKTSVASGEAGGITQHIGAYRVETSKGTICFLDTPGHAAFTSMRARGASVTDIVVLIVAADDGVMPQTKEAISHAREANVPIIVAINKIDKPGVDTERVIRELASEGLQAESWGGDTIMVKLSAKTGEGIDQLLEMLLLQAEMLELKAFTNRRARGVVVEAMLHRGRGPVATVLVQDGVLERGDVLLAGTAFGKIRAMVDERGKTVKSAGPSTPVEVLGLGGVPAAGDLVYAVKNLRAAETLAQERSKKARKSVGFQKSTLSLDDIAKHLAQGEQFELKVIVKADVQGSVEALTQVLNKLSTDKVKLVVVHTAVGGITETDINLATAANAIVIGFNVRPVGKARKSAEAEGVEIRLYSIIYEVIDDVRRAMEGLLPATKVEKDLGRAEIRMVIGISKVGNIGGSMVLSGIIRRNAEARLVRDSRVVWTGKISSLKRNKDDAREVREGFECGIGLENYNDVKEGDIIECFEIEEVKATL